MGDRLSEESNIPLLPKKRAADNKTNEEAAFGPRNHTGTNISRTQWGSRSVHNPLQEQTKSHKEEGGSSDHNQSHNFLKATIPPITDTNIPCTEWNIPHNRTTTQHEQHSNIPLFHTNGSTNFDQGTNIPGVNTNLPNDTMTKLEAEDASVNAKHEHSSATNLQYDNIQIQRVEQHTSDRRHSQTGDEPVDGVAEQTTHLLLSGDVQAVFQRFQDVLQHTNDMQRTSQEMLLCVQQEERTCATILEQRITETHEHVVRLEGRLENSDVQIRSLEDTLQTVLSKVDNLCKSLESPIRMGKIPNTILNSDGQTRQNEPISGPEQDELSNEDRQYNNVGGRQEHTAHVSHDKECAQTVRTSSDREGDAKVTEVTEGGAALHIYSGGAEDSNIPLPCRREELATDNVRLAIGLEQSDTPNVEGRSQPSTVDNIRGKISHNDDGHVEKVSDVTLDSAGRDASQRKEGSSVTHTDVGRGTHEDTGSSVAYTDTGSDVDHKDTGSNVAHTDTGSDVTHKETGSDVVKKSLQVLSHGQEMVTSEHKVKKIEAKSRSHRQGHKHRTMSDSQRRSRQSRLKCSDLGLKYYKTKENVDNRMKVIRQEVTLRSGTQCVLNTDSNIPLVSRSHGNTKGQLSFDELNASKEGLLNSPGHLQSFLSGSADLSGLKTGGSDLSRFLPGASDLVRMGAQKMTDADIATSNMWVERANEERRKGTIEAPGRGTGPDTVLLLDISESMRGQPFEDMIRIASRFIEGIQHVYLTMGVGENIGIATFGHQTRVLRHLTVDYGDLLASLGTLDPGGTSPMSAGLLMGLAAVLGNISGGVTHVKDKRLFPRIIMISDGRATPDRSTTEEDANNVFMQAHVRVLLDPVLCDHAQRGNRVFCVPVGDATPESESTGEVRSAIPYKGIAGKTHFDDICKVTKARTYTANDVEKLVTMTLSEVLAIEMFSGLKGNSRDHIVELLNASRDPLAVGVHRYPEEIADYIVFLEVRETPHSGLDAEHAEKDPDMPPMGTRVRRGPNWKWNNQDTEGPGTVIGHQKNGSIWIEWDNGMKNRYPYSHGVYGVQEVDEPRLMADQLIATGFLVRPGADWTPGEQDDRAGSVGVVFCVKENGMIGVRWPNQKMGMYKYGADGRFEVEICDPLTTPRPLLKTCVDMTFSSRSPSENEVNLPPNEINRHTNDTSLPRDERELPRRSARDLRRNEHQQAENAQQRVLSGDPSPNLSLSPPTGSYWSSVDELNERNRSYVTRNTNSEETDRTSSRGYIRTGATCGAGDAHSSGTPGLTFGFCEASGADAHDQQNPTVLDTIPNQPPEPVRTVPEPASVSQEPKSTVPYPIARWQYCDSDGNFQDYPEDLNDRIEAAFTKRPRGTTIVNIDRVGYRIIFVKMVQVNTETRSTVSIRRTVIS